MSHFMISVFCCALCNTNRERVLGGIRTPGILIRSQVLYPLSYKDNCCLHFVMHSTLMMRLTLARGTGLHRALRLHTKRAVLRIPGNVDHRYQGEPGLHYPLWCSRVDLNHRLPSYQDGTLTTELREHKR